MFTYFHQHKLKYEKGQLLPVFIVVLAVILIMAMITVNLSKVSSIKTDSANGVDAGGLAAGSAMANLFNSIASTNTDFEKAYWTFYTSIQTAVILALVVLYLAIISAATVYGIPAALASMKTFYAMVVGIIIAITAYWGAMVYFYWKIRDVADDGRKEAVKIGHKFSFINSGIGAKLKNEKIPVDSNNISGDANNYYSSFGKFLEGLTDGNKYVYSWRDGQQRLHTVESEVTLDKVKTYKLRTGLYTGAAAVEELGGVLDTIKFVEGLLRDVLRCLTKCSYCTRLYKKSCRRCCKRISGKIRDAVKSMLMVYFLMGNIPVGLLPTEVVVSNSKEDAMGFIICWIEDIEHSYQVRVDSWQEHQGVDLEIWQTQYPKIHSYSLADFRWKGQMHPPKLEYDASIIATDQIGQ